MTCAVKWADYGIGTRVDVGFVPNNYIFNKGFWYILKWFLSRVGFKVLDMYVCIRRTLTHLQEGASKRYIMYI